MKNILFSGGGTLGHIYPIVCVVKQLYEEGYNLYFIGTKTGLERDFIESLNVFKKTFYLDSEGLKRNLTIKNIKAILKHFKNIRKTKQILKDLNIDLVIGMGGYVSAGVVQAGIKLKIKTMIHEQNSVYGLANKLLHKKVTKVLLASDIDSSPNAVVIGNPRLSEIYEKYKNSDDFNSGNFIVVVGGSRGAAKINDLIISLKNQFMNSRIDVILITGKKYSEENIKVIREVSEEKFKIIDFSNDLPSLLIKAKLVVSRSGACTIAEIMALRKVCLFIPSPNVTNNHQEKNAFDIIDKGCALMLKESKLTKEELFDNIYKLYYNKELRNRLMNNMIFNIRVDSKTRFIKEINNLLQ